MNITVEVTANHMGYFTFSLCPVVVAGQDPDKDCFDNPDQRLRVVSTVG